MKPVGKPDAGNPHVRFDERGGETDRSRGTAPIGRFAVQFEGTTLGFTLFDKIQTVQTAPIARQPTSRARLWALVLASGPSYPVTSRVTIGGSLVSPARTKGRPPPARSGPQSNPQCCRHNGPASDTARGWCKRLPWIKRPAGRSPVSARRGRMASRPPGLATTAAILLRMRHN